MAAFDSSLKRNVLNGFYRGQVIKHCSNGKCKIWIPGVYVEEAVTHPEILPDAELAAPLFGGSSNGSGIYTYPRINAIVWCFFLNGDLNLPVYFASCNGGPEAARQYKQIGPDGKYEEYGKEHDHIIDVTDKISDAEIHAINVSKGSIRFYEDGSIQTTVVKTNPLGAPYNVNLPYSESHHVLNTLSNVIFPGKVTDPLFVSDSPYNYHTNDVVSGLNNYAFGISCNINETPHKVFEEITSTIGKCCIKGYKTLCRYVYAKEGQATKKKDNVKPIYIEEEIDTVDEKGKPKKEYSPINYHWEMFKTICDIDLKVDDKPVYEITLKNKVTEAIIDGIKYKVGDKIRISKREVVRDITKALVYKVEVKNPQCMVLIAAEDCSINKWDYILSSGYDLFLCSPSEFGNPVLYFDKKFDSGYSAQCPLMVWPPMVDPKVAAYKASIILMEDRRKYSSTRFNKNGTINNFLSDSYDESYFKQTISGTGDIEGEAYKQDYEDWNKTHNYYQGQAVQAVISGYNTTIWGFTNDNLQHNGVLSMWSYQVRQHVPKSPAEWWYYNNYLYTDKHNGICVVNDNLSITYTPLYWQKVIGFTEHNIWPRWDREVPMDPYLKEQISCGYFSNVNEGIASWRFCHLSNYAEMSFSRLSADYNGSLGIEATKDFNLYLNDVRHSEHPKHCGDHGNAGIEPYIHNEWTHIKFTREGELTFHGTKFIELSCSDPYKQYDFSHFLITNDGTVSVNNSKQINLMTMMPPAGRDGPEDAIPKGCCDWPVQSVPKHDTIRGDNTDWPFAKLGLRNDGDIDIDAYHQIDLFANPNLYWGRTWQSLTKSVEPGAPKSSDPPAPPRAHLRLCGGPATTANTKDIVEPKHKTNAGSGGTIAGDCCNTISFFSTNGDIILENANKNGPSDIVIKNSQTATNGITLKNENNAAAVGILLENSASSKGIFLHNVGAASTGIELDNKASGNIKIHTASGDITIQTDGGNYKLEVVGNIDVHCTGNMTANVDGNMNATVGGTTTVNSSGAMTLKAPTITLDGNVTVTKTLKVNGAQTNSSTITASGEIKSGAVTLTKHKHSENQSGDYVSPGVMTGPGVG